MRSAVLFLLSLASAGAVDLAQTIDLARAAPPEIFANTVLDLAESGSGPWPSAELIEQAFTAAAQAHEPVRLFVMPGVGPDTRATFRSKASALGLDTLSLQARAVKLAAKTDPRKALELFRAVRRPDLDRRPCADPLIADPSVYYDMAGAVSAGSNDVQFLQGVLAAVRSPAELAPAARLLLHAKLKPEEMDLLLATLAAKMAAAPPDFRAFTTTVEDLSATLHELAASSRDQSASAQGLQEGFHRLVAAQMTAARCDEDFGGAMNVALKLGERNLQPSDRLGGFEAASGFDSGDAKRLWEAFGLLRIEPGVGPRFESDRATAAWLHQADDFLRDYSAWMPTGAAIDTFHLRMTLLNSLLTLAPSGDTRDHALGEAVGVLSSSPEEREAPAEWFYEVKSLVEAAGSDTAKLMEIFRRSGDPALELFALTRPASP
jgi:hypothetical protein